MNSDRPRKDLYWSANYQPGQMRATMDTSPADAQLYALRGQYNPGTYHMSNGGVQYTGFPPSVAATSVASNQQLGLTQSRISPHPTPSDGFVVAPYRELWAWSPRPHQYNRDTVPPDTAGQGFGIQLPPHSYENHYHGADPQGSPSRQSTMEVAITGVNSVTRDQESDSGHSNPCYLGTLSFDLLSPALIVEHCSALTAQVLVGTPARLFPVTVQSFCLPCVWKTNVAGQDRPFCMPESFGRGIPKSPEMGSQGVVQHAGTTPPVNMVGAHAQGTHRIPQVRDVRGSATGSAQGTHTGCTAPLLESIIAAEERLVAGRLM
ncbi:hypothetical protein OH76DRAFT_1423136 [Lentinus brumalis]|uniref:Uncharacterized protein n=1 Tax=Lentinus brumalis TaxID=2498619 RepID=A0A371CM82_9APHY|nr:hypothetical protein OH76DRAFT_1423136 [Polyporus brumalis]